MPPERVVRVRPRTVVAVLAIIFAVLGLLWIIWSARQVITWILIALFLALALNPLVEWFQRRGIRRRGFAAAIAFTLAIAAFAALTALFVPILVREVRDFVDALPGLVQDLTEGRGRLGFLETEYHIVDKVRELVSQTGADRILGASGTVLAVTKGVLTAVVAVITIIVLTFFFLLEGPVIIERALMQVPEGSRGRTKHVLTDIYKTVGGYVSGALLIALIAGVSATVLLSILGVPYAFALGLLVAMLDLIPLAGATLGAVVVTTVAFLTESVGVGIGVGSFFVVYQQVENHVLYPAVYSRTVQLSALTIIIAVLIGASLGGILGALAAIPVAGTIQVLLRDWLRYRRPGVVA